MIELDETTRRVLLQRAGPPSGSRERVLAGLRTSLGPGPGGPGGSGESGPPSPSTGGGELALSANASQGASVVWAAKVVGLTLGLASVGVGALTLAAAASKSSESPTANASATSVSSPRVPPPPRSPALAHATQAPDEAPASTPAPTPAPDAQASPPAPRPSPSNTPSASQTEPPASTLDAELALLQAAKRASDPQAALDILAQHRARFASGELARERDALGVELLCALGQFESADEARARFIDDYPDAPVQPKRCKP